jgi:hypothetical protein
MTNLVLEAKQQSAFGFSWIASVSHVLHSISLYADRYILDFIISSAMTFWVREEDENGSAAVAERRVGGDEIY